MPLETGTKLGRYEIRDLLGAGGMGEVYRAHDAQLDRDVAVKVLPAAITESASALERFQREARAVAALEHPNILAIHDFGVDDGRAWAAMELLRGTTLRERLAEGPIPPRKVVELACQLAEGLAAAHKRRIVHRDVKPENVFVNDTGQLKVLDFGLASDRTAAEPGGDDTSAPTRTNLTDPGTVMGTVGYMSPEQVRGEPADHRSDVFSFGCVLYEMLTGQRAFERDSRADTMTAVLRDEPAELATPAGPVAPALERVVRRCLEKNPAERFQSANDLAFAIANSTTSGSTVSGAEPIAGEDASAGSKRRVAGRRYAGLGLAGAAALVLLGVFLGLFLGRATVPPAGDGSSLSGTLRQVTFEPPGADQPSIAPDGETVAFVRSGDIYFQRIGGEKAINLTPDSPAHDYHPAFSPDGQRIAFRSERDGGGIYVMGATGESVRRIADFGYNPAWSPDGKEIVVGTEAVNVPDDRWTASQLWRLDVTTGSRSLVTESDAVQPDWSPSGERIVFWSLPSFTGAKGGKTNVVQTIPAEGGEPTVLVDDRFWNWSPRWSADGTAVVFCSDRSGVMNLWRLPVDETTGRATGEAVPVTSGELRHGFASVAENGTLAFAAERAEYTVERASFDPATLAAGEPRTVLRTTRRTLLSDVSASGDWILLQIVDLYEDLLVMRSDGTGRLRLTHSPAMERGPSFGPQADLVYFVSPRSGEWVSWQVRRDGGGLAQVLQADPLGHADVSPDGRWLAGYSILRGEAGIVDLERPADERVIEWIPRSGARRMFDLAWSPDGTKLAGSARTETEIGGILLYTHATGETELVRETGFSPAFLPDGRILFHDNIGAVVLDLSTGAETRVDLGALADSDELIVSPDGHSVFGWTVTTQPDVWVLSPGTEERSGTTAGEG